MIQQFIQENPGKSLLMGWVIVAVLGAYGWYLKCKHFPEVEDKIFNNEQ